MEQTSASSAAQVPGPGTVMVGDLPPELARDLRAEMAEGEELVWCGRPNADRAAERLHLRRAFWGIFTAFGVLTLLWPTDHLPVQSIMMLLVGAAGLLEPRAARRRAARTWYFLSSHHAFVVSPKGDRFFWFSPPIITVKAFTLEQLRERRTMVHDDGSGDIVFSGGKRHDGRPLMGFLSIDHAQGVEEKIEHLVSAGRRDKEAEK